MKMLTPLSERFSVSVAELLDLPLENASSELSDDEVHLLKLYRKSRTMPPKMRTALRESIESMISLYIKTSNELKANARDTRKKGGTES